MLREFHLDNPSQYFTNYVRRYTDMPMRVMLEERDGYYAAGATYIKIRDKWWGLPLFLPSLILPIFAHINTFAYAFSAGGPVIWPNVKALQLLPLAAHALFARPLIIGSGSPVTIDILDDSMSEGWICCDGMGRKPLWCGDTGPEVVQRVAWCTGGGQLK